MVGKSTRTYRSEKRRKELARLQKREAKRLKRLTQAADPMMGATPPQGIEPPAV